jgi:DNA-binding NarL/FixJ family response regulator
MVSLRVLLVDDNALFRDGIADILEADGRFRVVGQASRGDEAVAAASRLHPDLILMDLRMPGMSGAEAIRRIRAQDPAVPIGVLTVFETQESAQMALDAGATGYLAKDSTPADLCDAAAIIAQGKRNFKQRLGISPRTLRIHITHTYRKLQIHDRAQAVIAAIRAGLVEVRPE